MPSDSTPWLKRHTRRMAVVDMAAVLLALLAAYAVRFHDDILDTASAVSSAILALAVFGVWTYALHRHKTYRAHILGTGQEEFRRVAASGRTVFGIWAVLALVTHWDISRGYVAMSIVLGFLLLCGGRLINRSALRRERVRGGSKDPALIIGSRREIAYVVQSLVKTPTAGYRVVAISDGDEPSALAMGEDCVIPNVGEVEDMGATLTRLGCTTVIVAGESGHGRETLRQLSSQLEDSGTNLVLASSLTDVAGPRIHWSQVASLPLISVELPRYTGTKYAVKRVLDIILSAALLLLLSPVFLVTAVLVASTSSGPVFFRQERIGTNGVPFIMTKFRSMHTDAEKQRTALVEAAGHTNILFKLKNDPRVTPIGSFLRKYSIDELPQLWDVLRGDMSMVGPRPWVRSEVDLLEPRQRHRLAVKPGITGPWQVGGRSDLSAEESLRLDLAYVENWSISGDFYYMIKTVSAVFAKHGAY